MNNIKTNSENDYKDLESTGLIQKILASHRRIMPDLNSMDKWANIDGSLTVHDDNGALIDHLDAQVKTLPQNHNLRFNCPIELFPYCYLTARPVIFLAVDNEIEEIYWIHFDREFISKSNYESNRKTKTILLIEEQVIRKDKTDYIKDWQGIASEHKNNAPKYKGRQEKLREIYSNLPTFAGNKDEFINMHCFLDRVNNLLDNEFISIKEKLYPSSWKLGLAYNCYEKNKISYGIYPINHNTNDVQIKEMDDKCRAKIQQAGFSLVGHYVENPIENKPLEYAIEFVESELLTLLRYRLLNHKGNLFLSWEYLIAFIDKFHLLMGLEQKDEYSLSEVLVGFREYLPVLIEEILKQRNIQAGKINIRLDRVLSMLNDGNIEQIKTIVRNRVNNKDLNKTTFTLDDKFSIRIVDEFLIYISEKKVENIKRIYLKKDYSRLRGKSGFKWELLSLDGLGNNLQIFYDNLPQVFEDIVEENFPKVKNEVKFFDKFNRLILIYNGKDEYTDRYERPILEYYCIKDPVQTTPRIELYREGRIKVDTIIDKDKGACLKIEEETYSMNNNGSKVLEFIFDETPMFNFIYDLLETKFKNFFTSMKETNKGS